MKKFSREEVYENTLKYFNGDTLATNVWINKYALKDSEENIYELNPDEMHHRIAKEIFKIEQKYINPLSEQEIYELLKDFKYIVPGGSAMAGIGNDLQITSISNCFVIGNESDSYGGIVKIDEEQVQLMKRRGGVGHDLSHIRPKGSPVKNSALTSTGIVPFMERYSNSTREVAQDGRRGALLLSLHCKHLDLSDFINAKLEDGKITGANISVKITNEFLDAVINNKEFEQQFPVTGKAKIKKNVNAKEIWNKLIYNNWRSAEPGILFVDNLNKGISEMYEQYKGMTTNPCVIGDTLILTNIGWIKIKTLFETFKQNSEIKILSQDKTGKFTLSNLLDVMCTEKNAELYKVTFSNNEYIITNIRHKLYTKDYKQVSVESLFYCPEYFRKDFKFISGNGKKLLKFKNIERLNYTEDVYDLKCNPNYNFFSVLNKEEIIYDDYVTIETLFNDKHIQDYLIKAVLNVDCGEIFMATHDTCRLLSMNLYNYVENPFTKKAKFNIELFEYHVKRAQRMMDNMVDIEINKIDSILNKISTDPESDDIKRTEIELWNKIKKTTNNGRRTGLGFTALGDAIAAMNLQYSTKRSIEFIDVIMTSFAKASIESSIDLAQERGSFDGFDYETEVRNDLIQLILPNLTKEYQDKYKQFGRRNVAQTAIAPCGSISIMTKTSSGIEPVFMIYYTRRKKVNPNDKNSKIVFTDKQGDSFEEYNVVHHKFILWYSIYRNINEQEATIELSKLSKEEFDKLIIQSPYCLATANEIDWINRTKIQGIIQKYIQQSISSTCNLPNNITEQEISDIYLEAWKQGCKGFTVYREGSRDGILVNSNKLNKDWETTAPKRPKVLPSEIIKFTNKGEKWIGIVGLLDNKPYELFTGKLESFNVPQKIEKGFNIRNKKDDGTSRYDFQYIDGDGFKCTLEGLNRAFDKEYWNLSKTISAVLRHGMPLNSILELVDSFKFDEEGDGINTWKSGVKRAIKKYIKDGTVTKNKCPDCGEKLVFSEGCVKCPNCSWSACG